MIRLCKNCVPHEFQDKLYGLRMRVQNPCFRAGSRQLLKWRCTVCGNVEDAPKSDKVDSNKEKKEGKQK